MDIQQQFREQVFRKYYAMLQKVHEQLGSDKDAVLYEKIIVLGHFLQSEMDYDDFFRQIELWILERRSLIAYFCNESKIESSLEALITSNNPEDIGVDRFVYDVAKERLKQVKNGMEDMKETEG